MKLSCLNSKNSTSWRRMRSYRTTMKRMRKKPPRMSCRTSLRRKS
jgi:hypothetical protein